VQSLSKILLPVDFSERSVSAARCAKPLALHFQAQLMLLHVLPPVQYQYGPAEFGGALLSDLYENHSALVNQDLEKFLCNELQGVNVQRVVLDGDPAQQIVAFAHQQAADLIIMPTHGYGPFRRFILGSNTAKVLHDADCPVWTGIHMENAPSPVVHGPLRNILCAVDLGTQSEKTLAWATWLQKEFDARLTLLHVTAPMTDLSENGHAYWRQHVREAVQEELEHLRQAAGCHAELRVESGDPSQIICGAAGQVEADALVIGRGSAAGVYGRLRTNAYAIIRQSPCPVVSV
jgi:nucleotide-binding universal stress UspA family protein